MERLGEELELLAAAGSVVGDVAIGGSSSGSVPWSTNRSARAQQGPR